MKGQKAFAEKRGERSDTGGSASTGAILGYAKIVKRVKRVTKVTGGSKISVESAGFSKEGNYASIKVNDKDVLARNEAKKGLNMVSLDFVTHKVNFKKSYDTNEDSKASNALVEDFEKLPAYSIVIVAVKDEASKTFDKKAR